MVGCYLIISLIPHQQYTLSTTVNLVYLSEIIKINSYLVRSNASDEMCIGRLAEAHLYYCICMCSTGLSLNYDKPHMLFIFFF